MPPLYVHTPDITRQFPGSGAAREETNERHWWSPAYSSTRRFPKRWRASLMGSSPNCPAQVRHSRLSLLQQIGPILGGGLSPLLATALLARYGTPW